MQEKYCNAFMGYGPEDKNFCLELTQNYGTDHYDLGTGFGHFALALPDVYKACESIKKAGESCHNVFADSLHCTASHMCHVYFVNSTSVLHFAPKQLYSA